MTDDAGVMVRAVRVDTPTRRRLTIDDVLRGLESGAIDPDARFELIDGEIIDMPYEGPLHANLKSEIIAFFARHLEGRRKLMTESVLVLSPDETPVPEMSVYERGATARPMDIGQLHLVVEVADSTLRYDLTTKRSLYERFGIPELWIVDARGEQTLIYRLTSKGAYGEPERVPFGDILRPHRLPEIEIRIDELPVNA